MDGQYVAHILVGNIKQALMITAFVLTMMLLIEYINVQTKSLLSSRLKENRFGQILLAAILGITPGCLGAYTVVSLYTHRVVSFAAIVTVMIATSGDEAFVMFTMIPETAVKLHILIFIIAILAGWLVDKFFKKKMYGKRNEPLPYHHENPEECLCFNKGKIIPQLKNISFNRFLLMVGTLTFLYLLLASIVGPSVWNWKKWIFLLSSAFALFVFATAPDHFLEEHIWNHIIKKHLFRIFSWTLGAIFVIHLLDQNLNVSAWMNDNPWLILLVAILIGIIPESGPHMVFITLYAQGLIPFSILLANSIVQDGHGMLPMLAESKRDFLLIKAINMVIGGIVGSIALLI